MKAPILKPKQEAVKTALQLGGFLLVIAAGIGIVLGFDTKTDLFSFWFLMILEVALLCIGVVLILSSLKYPYGRRK